MRDIFKKRAKNGKINDFIKKYKIPKEYLTINRKSITKGLGFGIFIGFIPMPFQMLAVLAVTPFIVFNVPIAIAMVWLSNPLTMPLMYYMEYQTGLYFLQERGLPDIELTLGWFQNHLHDIVIPLYVGTIPYSVFGSILVYLLVNIFWIRSIEEYKRLKKVRRWLRVAKRYRKYKQKINIKSVTKKKKKRRKKLHIIERIKKYNHKKYKDMKNSKKILNLVCKYKRCKKSEAINES
ncbi:hypothetical protein MNB_SV-15-346 [hydrothermal vent metagenome]|uniref:DUF2062 domain-containing protein n=1 Tax=hydrothermal vent metagenome TaxID=652676 RepID=A0A1W1EIK7_9ZZZZ